MLYLGTYEVSPSGKYESPAILGYSNHFIKVSSSWAESFDILLDAYQELSQRLPLLEEYKALFGDNPYMRDILVMIYEDILEFHQSALRFFGRPSESCPVVKPFSKKYSMATTFPSYMEGFQRPVPEYFGKLASA